MSSDFIGHEIPMPKFLAIRVAWLSLLLLLDDGLLWLGGLLRTRRPFHCQINGLGLPDRVGDLIRELQKAKSPSAVHGRVTHRDVPYSFPREPHPEPQKGQTEPSLVLLSERLNRERLQAIGVPYAGRRELNQLFRHHLGHWVFPIYQAQRCQYALEDVVEHGHFFRRKYALSSQEFVDWHGVPQTGSVASGIATRVSVQRNTCADASELGLGAFTFC
jgi:hypothetical protein